MVKYVVEFGIDESWIQDGYELTQNRVKAMIEKELSFAYSGETYAKILEMPTDEQIAQIQGFENVEQLHKVRRKQ